MNGSEGNIQICNVLCNYDFKKFFEGGEENLRPEGWGHTLYGADKRGIEVKTKPEMKRPYWVRSSSIAWSLTVMLIIIYYYWKNLTFERSVYIFKK